MPTTHCTCGAKYRFDESVIGKKARCKKCGTVFTIAPDSDDGPIPIAADDPFGAEMAAAAQRAKATPSESTHDAEAIRTTDASPTPPLVDGSKPSKGYGSSLLRTFLFPTSIHNLAIFCVFWGLLCMSGLVLPFAGCVGTLGRLVILGWYCAFRFETITIAAGGEDDLPRLSFSEGVYEDVVLPMVRWLGSWAVVFVPAVACLIILTWSGSVTASDLTDGFLGGISGMTKGASPELLTFVLLAFLAQFLWPMVALCVGVGGFESLSRIDLMVVTIVKTFPVYLLTAGMVFAASFVSGLVAEVSDDNWTASILVIGAGLYFETVAMRVIGLYYHHFKHRFAWSWG